MTAVTGDAHVIDVHAAARVGAMLVLPLAGSWLARRVHGPSRILPLSPASSLARALPAAAKRKPPQAPPPRGLPRTVSSIE